LSFCKNAHFGVQEVFFFFQKPPVRVQEHFVTMTKSSSRGTRRFCYFAKTPCRGTRRFCYFARPPTRGARRFCCFARPSPRVLGYFFAKTNLSPGRFRLTQSENPAPTCLLPFSRFHIHPCIP
jgi:hypothetical protein